MTLKSTDYSAHLFTKNPVMGNIIAIGAQSLLQSRDRRGRIARFQGRHLFRFHCLRPQADPFACERRPIQCFTGSILRPGATSECPNTLSGEILWRVIMAFDKSTSAAICARG